MKGKREKVDDDLEKKQKKSTGFSKSLYTPISVIIQGEEKKNSPSLSHIDTFLFYPTPHGIQYIIYNSPDMRHVTLKGHICLW